MKKAKMKRITIFGIDPKPNGTGIVYFTGIMSNKRCSIKFVESELIEPDRKYNTLLACEKHDKNVYILGRILNFIVSRIPHNHVGTTFFAIEGLSFASRGQRFLDLAVLNGLIKYELIAAFEGGVFEMPPGMWKLLALGKGNANKRLISKLAYQKYKFDDNREDVVDAFCIGLAFAKLLCEKGVTKKHLDSIERLSCFVKCSLFRERLLKYRSPENVIYRI